MDTQKTDTPAPEATKRKANKSLTPEEEKSLIEDIKSCKYTGVELAEKYNISTSKCNNFKKDNELTGYRKGMKNKPASTTSSKSITAPRTLKQFEKAVVKIVADYIDVIKEDGEDIEVSASFVVGSTDYEFEDLVKAYDEKIKIKEAEAKKIEAIAKFKDLGITPEEYKELIAKA